VEALWRIEILLGGVAGPERSVSRERSWCNRWCTDWPLVNSC